MSIHKEGRGGNPSLRVLSPVELRQRERFIRRSAQVSAKYLRRMEELPRMPEEMSSFIQVLKQIYVDMESVQGIGKKKTIGTFCVMVPFELIEAAGGVPVRLCSGSYTAYAMGDEVTPRDACPLVKAVMGFENIGVMPVYRDCSLYTIPITCDCKKKTAGLLAAHKKTVPLYIPAHKEDDDDSEQFLNELYRLIPILEETTGERVTCESLAHSIAAYGYAQYELSEFLSCRRNEPELIFGTHAMAVMNAAAYMPVTLWAANLHRLNAELKARQEKKIRSGRENQPKLLITGSPILFPNIKVPLLIEEMGGLLVGDETCMGERMLYDPVVVTDDSFDGMMRGLADRYTRPCTCPTFADNSQRIYRIKQLIRDSGAEGVIYHVLRGCLVYDYEYQIMEEELGKIQIPVIRVESDYNEEDIEQLRIRIEAFIEMIKLEKH